ncbi:MAG: rRNA maturation RNase YbeY [Candidatus Dormibacteraeota bacterium]|nr:rRNA maturation RNase YbeY [Candidatus Dormibacteraeota bacterium]
MARSAGLGDLLRGALQDLRISSGRVNCRLTGAREMTRLNRAFSGQNSSTDVLAFPASETAAGFDFTLPPGPVPELGDIVISVPDAWMNAPQGPAEELRLLAVHGLLHLLGHDHHEAGEARRMTIETRRLLGLAADRRGEAAPRVPALVPAGR